jgi:basic membrane protein A
LPAVLLAFSLVAAACGSGDDGASDDVDSTDGTEASSETTVDDTADETAPETTEEEMADNPLDANGDGEVRIGIAAQGPRDDGGYYQALIDQAEQLSAENGFGEVIVVDEISFEEAATELDNLANQPVDIILVGASGVAGPLPELAAKYPDIYWYCNCGAGFAASDDYAQTQDEGAGIHYTAGVAFGLLLQESGGDSVAMIGCCDLGFEKEALLATELGLQAVDESFTITYIPSGDFPFDFDNQANATAAFDTAVAQGADAIYPFLGGALEPVAKLAVDAGLIVANPGSSSACGGDIAYDLTVRFDGGDYVSAVFGDIVSGDFPEGSIRVFTAGTDPDIVGAELCDAADLQPALDEAFATVASGDLDEAIGAIKAEAFAG